MPNPLDKVLELQIQRTMNALEANNMEAHYVARADQVKDFVAQMIPEGATVANGGSATLAETGVLDLLSSGKYNFLDRRTVTGEALDKLFHDCFNADWYLASSNAVTEKGELFNVDGNSNRVAAITFGPKNVLLIVGFAAIFKASLEYTVTNHRFVSAVLHYPNSVKYAVVPLSMALMVIKSLERTILDFKKLMKNG